jgi:hypothetical protein
LAKRIKRKESEFYQINQSTTYESDKNERS